MKNIKSYGYWTKEKVFKEAKKYNSRSELHTNCPGAYGSAKRNNWFEEFTWFKEVNKNPKGYWTRERVFKEAKKYTTIFDFRKYNQKAYSAAKRNNWLEEMDWIPSLNTKPKGYWTKERVIEEGKKYKLKSEFEKNCSGAYSKARKNGWLEEMDWFRSYEDNDLIDCIYVYKFESLRTAYVGRTINKRKRDLNHHNQNDPVGKFVYSKDLEFPEMEIIEDNLTIRQGQEREDYWMRYYKSEGWTLLNTFPAGGVGAIGFVKWTYETCKEEASKYSSRGEFSDKCHQAHHISVKNGWINEFFPETYKTKRVDQLNLKEDHIKTFNSIIEASRETNTSDCGISSCLNGRQKTAGGYKWRYHDPSLCPLLSDSENNNPKNNNSNNNEENTNDEESAI